MIDTSAKSSKNQKLLDVGDQEWTPFYEKINQLMLEEKKCRQDNDSILGAEICVKILQAAFDEKDYAHLREWML